MEEQMKEQFDRFQNGFKSIFETSQKMMEPALRSSEVAIDSFSQLAKDQYEFGRSCLDISRRQMESLQSGNDATALLRDTGAPSDFYNATLRYGEALRQNAEQTRDRMMTIGREATDTMAGAGARAYQTAAAQAEKASDEAQAASSKSKKASEKSA